MASTAEARVPELELNDRLRLTREKAGISREKMALYMGVSTGTISHWENGRKRPADVLTTVTRWAARTGFDKIWLTYGSSTMYEPTAPRLFELIRGEVPEQLPFRFPERL